MVKSKSRVRKRRQLSEKITASKVIADSTKKTNPFEFKLNREKHAVLGRITKHSKGMPGVSRSVAVMKRKQTLLKEYQKRNKVNKFLDNRFGEYDKNMTKDEKMIARFSAAQKNRYEKNTKVCLGAADKLTHLGKPLDKINKYDDPRSDSEDEGILGEAFVKGAHFGGPTNDNPNLPPKSRQDHINELLHLAKQQKQEKVALKETAINLTSEVDTEWKSLQSVIKEYKRTTSDEEPKKKLQDYDICVRELLFESRAKPTDRLKTPDEIAKEEKEKLEKLEADRVRRMNGIVEDDEPKERTGKFKSVDALDDMFLSPKETEEFVLSYKDGKLVDNDLKLAANVKKRVSFKDDDVFPDDKSSVNDSDNDDQEESDSYDSDVDEDVNESNDEDEKDDDNEIHNDEDELKACVNNSDESEDSYSDVQSDTDPENEVDLVEDAKRCAVKSYSDIESKSLLLVRKRMMDSARNELPYVFNAPDSYDDFLNDIEGHSTSNQLIILDRIIKCHHPSLSEGNLSKLEKLFEMLLKYVNDLMLLDTPDFEFVDGVIEMLYALGYFSPANAVRCMQAVILEKQNNFQKMCDHRLNGHIKFPELDTAIFLKLTAVIFPTSDYFHPVVTPAALFMSQMLTKCVVLTCRDVAFGLFLCNVFLEYVSLSKRFVPEAVNFLCGCFLCALDRSEMTTKLPFVHPFKGSGPQVDLFFIQKDCREMKWNRLSLQQLNMNKDVTDDFRISALHICTNLLHRFAELYSELPSFPIIFNPLLQHHCLLPLDKFPDETKTAISNLVNFLKEKISTFTLKRLVQEKKRVRKDPTCYEPLIEENFDGRRRRGGNPDKQRHQKLLHVYKREKKGAMREMRRDNKFLASVRLREQLESDAQRKRKYKEIMRDLSEQEGFVNELKRKKKYGRF